MTNVNILIGDMQEAYVEQAAQILMDAFAENWPDMASALEEVRDVWQEGHICRVAVGDDDRVLGWIGGLPEYDGNVCELHPLAVRPDMQGKGVGRWLVQDFEIQVRKTGATTIMLGSDDVNGMTSLHGADLYDGLWDKVANIQNLKGHPYGFYQKMGYTIVGVIPDANGPGKPDILMAKRLTPS